MRRVNHQGTGRRRIPYRSLAQNAQMMGSFWTAASTFFTSGGSVPSCAVQTRTCALKRRARLSVRSLLAVRVIGAAGILQILFLVIHWISPNSPPTVPPITFQPSLTPALPNHMPRKTIAWMSTKIYLVLPPRSCCLAMHWISCISKSLSILRDCSSNLWAVLVGLPTQKKLKAAQAFLDMRPKHCSQTSKTGMRCNAWSIYTLSGDGISPRLHGWKYFFLCLTRGAALEGAKTGPGETGIVASKRWGLSGIYGKKATFENLYPGLCQTWRQFSLLACDQPGFKSVLASSDICFYMTVGRLLQAKA